MDKLLYLPVSLGEAIDKLTILDIKCNMILNEKKRIDVTKEYDLLLDKLNIYITKYKIFYDVMKQINKDIWYLMDNIRDGHLNNDEYIKETKLCIDLNDIRFRIKNKINNLSNSSIKEQKGYIPTKFTINIESINHTDECSKIILLYSLLYDNVIIVCNNIISNHLRQKFNYDDNICFNDIGDVNNLLITDDTINGIINDLQKTSNIYKILM